MPRVVSVHSVAATPAEAVAEIAEQLRAAAGVERIAGGFLQATVAHDLVLLERLLIEALPGVPFIGTTSCQGTATDRRRTSEGPALSGLWLVGEDVRVQVGNTREPERLGSGVTMVRAAVVSARTPGRQRFALLHATPGHEERLLSEVASQLGDVPVMGGTAADDDLSGKWGVFGSGGYHSGKGAVLAVVDWPGRVVASMQSTAMVTPTMGTVTRAEGRTLYEIDGQPAAEVYDRWLGGTLHRALAHGGSILGDTTLTPLGVRREGEGVGSYVLIHPEAITADTHALTTFRAVEPGQRLFLMKASKAGFLGRPASVVERLMTDAHLTPSSLCGALLVYCAGCMLTVKDGTGLMLDGFAGATKRVPFAAGYFFGEQGCEWGADRPEHGNLMTGALLLAV